MADDLPVLFMLEGRKSLVSVWSRALAHGGIKWMKSVWRGRGGGRVARREGSSGCEIYADVFESVRFSQVFFFLLPFPPFFPPLTVEAVCGWRGVGWLSRKGGWDAQSEGEKGAVQSSLTLRGTVMADSGGVGLHWKGWRGGAGQRR